MTDTAGELLPMDADPWDETPVTVPRGLLALLLNAAGKADEARLLGEKCPSDPCPTCTALTEIHEAVYPIQGSVARPDIRADVQPANPCKYDGEPIVYDPRENVWTRRGLHEYGRHDGPCGRKLVLLRLTPGAPPWRALALPPTEQGEPDVI